MKPSRRTKDAEKPSDRRDVVGVRVAEDDGVIGIRGNARCGVAAGKAVEEASLRE